MYGSMTQEQTISLLLAAIAALLLALGFIIGRGSKSSGVDVPGAHDVHPDYEAQLHEKSQSKK